MLSNLASDLRYGARVLKRSPGFVAIAVIALALGIGANTAVFSAIDAVLLRPLPYKDPSRLAFIWEDASHVGFPRNTPAPANYADWKKQNQVFENMAALRGRSMNLTGDGPAEYLRGNQVTPEFFPLMGVPAAIGRTLDERDDKSGDNSVVISYSLWQRRFNGDRSVLGKTIKLNGESYAVVGVMPRGFRFPYRLTDFWIPMKFTAETLGRRGSHFLNVVGRLKPGISWQRASADMDTIARRLQQDYPNTNFKLGAVVVPLTEEISGDSRTGLIVLLAGSGFVLLIACANVANLLLARSAARERELALRSALGAGRRRLITQLITESLMLSIAGGLAGLLLASGGLKLLARLVPERLDRALTLNSDVLIFSFLISVVTGIVFGVLPALHASRLDLTETLKQGGRLNTGGGGFSRDVLVVAEVSMALVLLAGAGLMMKTLARLQSVELGFRPDGLLAVRTYLPSPKYSQREAMLRHYDAVLQDVRAMPGVRSAAFAADLPFTTSGNTNGFEIEGRPESRTGPPQDALYRPGTTDYLKTLGATLVEGRLLGQQDDRNSPLSVVINETFARNFFPGESAVGRRVRVDGEHWITIVGVVKDIRERGVKPAPKAAMYFAITQQQSSWSVPDDLIVRVDGNPLALAGPIRAAIAKSDPDVPVIDIQLMQDILDTGTANPRQQMRLLMAFAALALTLAGLGIYGVLSYLVAQRTREIGIRMALGASAPEILRSVAGRGVALTGVGLVIGAVAAFAVTRAMSTMLYEVAPGDLPTYTSVIAILMTVGLIACTAPAWRAARVDPMTALRDE